MKMASLDKFCLRWNEFDKTVSQSFASLREENHFFDCTLVTDDIEESLDNLRAHKVILSACSEFFNDILTKKSVCAHPNPLIYLNGISSRELRHVLDFMYLGEVSVDKEGLDKFLEAAETLKVRGLARNSEENATKKRMSSSKSPQKLNKKCKLQTSINPSPSKNATESNILTNTEYDPLVNTAQWKDKHGDVNKETCFDEEYEGCDVGNENLSTSASAVQITDTIKIETEVPSLAENYLHGSNVSTKEEDFKGTNDSVHIDQNDEVQSNHDGEDNQGNRSNTEIEDARKMFEGDKNAKPKNDYKEKRRQKLLFYANNHDNGKQFSDAEKLTFVNLIKTMDPEGLLKANGWKEKSYEALAKRSVIWDKLVPAFNEICGTNCDVRRLKHALIRIKKTPHWKSHKLLFDLGK